MSFADDFERAGERIVAAHPEIESGKMFASFGYRTGGKYFAFAHRDKALALKLPAERVQALIAAGGAEFSSGGRVMREWVTTFPADEAECLALMDEAREFVASLQIS